MPKPKTIAVFLLSYNGRLIDIYDDFETPRGILDYQRRHALAGGCEMVIKDTRFKLTSRLVDFEGTRSEWLIERRDMNLSRQYKGV